MEPEYPNNAHDPLESVEIQLPTGAVKLSDIPRGLADTLLIMQDRIDELEEENVRVRRGTERLAFAILVVTVVALILAVALVWSLFA